MHTSNVPDRLAELADPLAASLDLSIWGLEYAAGPKSLVRVYIEGRDGTDARIDSCAELSRLLGLALDVEDIFPDAYVLEVSSPGLERTFFRPEQLLPYVGRTLEIALREALPAYPGRRKMIGVLTGGQNGLFTLLPADAPGPGLDPVSVCFAWSDAKKVKLLHFLPEAAGTKKGAKRKSP